MYGILLMPVQVFDVERKGEKKLHLCHIKELWKSLSTQLHPCPGVLNLDFTWTTVSPSCSRISQ